MYKSALIYSLKIWIICIIVSPVLFYLWANLYSDPYATWNFFDFWVLSSLYGLMWSSPCFALFLLANFYVGSKNWTALGKKIVLAIWAALLLLILVYILFGISIPTIKMMTCYLITIICETIFFKLPARNAGFDL